MRGITDWREKAKFWALPWLLIGAALWVGAPSGLSELPDNMESPYANIIVEFAAPPPSPEDDAAAPTEGLGEVAARILSRLEPEARESARVFEHLPLIALIADAETVLRLISMPEVLAIRPDKELELLPAPSASSDAPSGISLPDVTDEIAVPDSSGAITIPLVPGETAADGPDPESLEPDTKAEQPLRDELATTSQFGLDFRTNF